MYEREISIQTKQQNNLEFDDQFKIFEINTSSQFRSFKINVSAQHHQNLLNINKYYRKRNAKLPIEHQIEMHYDSVKNLHQLLHYGVQFSADELEKHLAVCKCDRSGKKRNKSLIKEVYYNAIIKHNTTDTFASRKKHLSFAQVCEQLQNQNLSPISNSNLIQSQNIRKEASPRSYRRSTIINKKLREDNSLKINIIGASQQISDNESQSSRTTNHTDTWATCPVEEERKEQQFDLKQNYFKTQKKQQ